MKEFIVPVNDTDLDFDEMFVDDIQHKPELIRCKDCEHFLTDGNTPICYHFAESIIFPEPNDYCSRSERKKHEID